MSIWATVSGVIWYKAYTGDDDSLPTKSLIGVSTSCDEYVDNDTGDNCTLPFYQEESLQYVINNALVTFWGNLRGCEEFDGLVEYFNSIVKDKSVSTGVFTAEVGSQVKTYTYDDDEKLFICDSNYQKKDRGYC